MHAHTLIAACQYSVQQLGRTAHAVITTVVSSAVLVHPCHQQSQYLNNLACSALCDAMGRWVSRVEAVAGR